MLSKFIDSNTHSYFYQYSLSNLSFFSKGMELLTFFQELNANNQFKGLVHMFFIHTNTGIFMANFENH